MTLPSIMKAKKKPLAKQSSRKIYGVDVTPRLKTLKVVRAVRSAPPVHEGRRMSKTLVEKLKTEAKVL